MVCRRKYLQNKSLALKIDGISVLKFLWKSTSIPAVKIWSRQGMHGKIWSTESAVGSTLKGPIKPWIKPTWNQFGGRLKSFMRQEKSTKAKRYFSIAPVTLHR